MIRVVYPNHSQLGAGLGHFLVPVAGDNGNISDPGLPEAFHASGQDGFSVQNKQGLEPAHTPGESGCQDQGVDVQSYAPLPKAHRG
jgi:hypothetical protein